MKLPFNFDFENFKNSFTPKDALSFYTFGTLETISFKWFGGVLALDGKIYCIPHNATNILVIDPETETTEFFGDLSNCEVQNGTVGLNKYSGGVLGPDGKIYCFPHTAKYMLIIDPETKTTEYITNYVFNDIYYGGVLGHNKMIYSLGYSKGNKILEINYKTKSIIEIPLTQTLSGTYGAVVHKNNTVYFLQGFGQLSLKFDVLTKEKSIIDSKKTGNTNWRNAVLTGNNTICFIPNYADTILELDMYSFNFSTFETLESGIEKFSGGVLAPNGNIYCVPFNANYILEINVFAKLIKKIGNITGIQKYQGGILAPNGKIYCIPHSANKILVIDTKETSYEQQVLTSPFFNKL